MTRRGDVEHTYRRYARELQAGVSPERARYLCQELEGLWWRMNEDQRRAAPQVKELRKGPGLPSVDAPAEDEKSPAPPEPEPPAVSTEDEEARRKWEEEVDARIAAAKSAKPASVLDAEHPEAGEFKVDMDKLVEELGKK